MIQPLRDLAEVRAGHPFRGSVPVADDGNAQVIQMRDVAPDGSVAWPALVRTRVAAHKSARLPDWLQDGDVLFAASRRAQLRGLPGAGAGGHGVRPVLLCASFAHRPRAPRFPGLAHQPGTQPALPDGPGRGVRSAQHPARVLEALPVAVPDLAQQQRLVDLAAAITQERRTFEALSHNRERELDALAQRLLQPSPRLQ